MSEALNPAAVRATAWFNRLALDGIDLTTNAHVKVEHEAIEFADEPSLEEAADVFISLIGALHARDWTPHDLALAVRDKMIINESRTWAKLPDGTYQHVEE